MGLPIGLDEVFGVAVADVLRRAGLIIGCVLGAMLVAGVGLGAGEITAALVEFRSIGSEVWNSVGARFLWLGLAPLGSGWGILYVPFMVGMWIYFVRADAPSVRAFSICVGGLALLLVLSAGDPHWFSPSAWWRPAAPGVSNPDASRLILKSVALVAWLGCAGGIAFFALMLERRARAKAEVHLMGVTIENELRRQELREQHGIVIADRDYAVEEELPS